MVFGDRLNMYRIDAEISVQLQRTNFSGNVMLCPLHRSIRVFHGPKQWWKSSFIREFRSFAEFCFTFSIDSNQVPFEANLIFKNSHKVLNQERMARVRELQCLQRLNNASQTALYGQGHCPGAIFTTFYHSSGCLLALTVLPKLANML